MRRAQDPHVPFHPGTPEIIFAARSLPAATWSAPASSQSLAVNSTARMMSTAAAKLRSTRRAEWWLMLPDDLAPGDESRRLGPRTPSYLRKQMVGATGIEPVTSAV
jgi:hypothetical protein